MLHRFFSQNEVSHSFSSIRTYKFNLNVDFLIQTSSKSLALTVLKENSALTIWTFNKTWLSMQLNHEMFLKSLLHD